MTKDIKNAFGKAITQDTENMVNQFSGNFEAINNNFNSLKKLIDEL
jgi:hypothetical protein